MLSHKNLNSQDDPYGKGKKHADDFISNFTLFMQDLCVHFETDHISLSTFPHSVKERLIHWLCGPSKCPREDYIQNFLTSLSAFIENIDHLELCLAPYAVDVDETTNMELHVNATLFSLLLNIDCLQKHLTNLLLEKLVEFPDNESDQAQKIPRTIIRHLQWVEAVVNPLKMAQKVMEILFIVQPRIQKEIIGALPEIIEPTYHKDILIGLANLLKENDTLMLDILDTLSCLSLTENDLAELRDSFISKLDSARIEDLPVIIKFIFQYIPSEKPQSVLQAISYNLDMSVVSHEFERQRANVSGKGKQVIRHDESLILGSFKSSFQLRSFLQDAWLKYLSSLSAKKACQDFDALILLIIYSLNPAGKRKASNLVKKLLHAGVMERTLLGGVLNRHFEGLVSYVPQLLSMAEYLLGITDSLKCQEAAGLLYLALFQKGDVFHKQDIIVSLVGQVGIENESLSESALNIVLRISEKYPVPLAQYAVFLKSIYDLVDKLSLRHVLLFYQILAKISVRTSDLANDSESTNLAELIMMIRKQTGNASDLYKIIGAIGAVCLIVELTRTDHCTQGNSEKAKQMFGIAWDVLQHEPCPLSIFFDLLALSVSKGDVDASFVSYCHDQIEDPFLSNFLHDGEFNVDSESLPYVTPSQKAAPKIWFKLVNGPYPRKEMKGGDEADEMEQNGQEETDTLTMAIQIYPCMTRLFDKITSTAASRHLDVRAMCGYFHLLRACYLHTHGNVDEMEAVLESPLILFENSNDLKTSLSSLGQFAIADTLYIAINWLRELLNGFIKQESTDNVKQAVLHRLRHLFECQTFLYNWTETLPGWTPLLAAKDLMSQSFDQAEAVELPTDLFGTGSDDDEMEFFEPPAPVKGKSRISKALMSPESLRGFFRELDWSAFFVLGDLKFRKENESDVVIEYPVAEFLLKELKSFVASRLKPARRGPKSCQSSVVQATSLQTTDVKQFLTTFVDQVLPVFITFTNRLELEISDAVSEEDYVVGVMDKPLHQSLSLVLDILHHVLAAICKEEMQISAFVPNILICFTNSGKNPSEEREGNDPFFSAVTFLLRLHKSIVYGSTAVNLLKVLEAMSSLAQNGCESVLAALRSVSQLFVVKEWDDRNRLKPETLEHLVRCQILYSPDPNQQMLEYVTVAFPALADRNEEALTPFTLLNNQTFGSFFKVTFAELTHTISTLEFGGNTNPDLLCQHIQETATIFASITKTLRHFSNNVILSITLRQGRFFLLAFIRTVLPIMTRLFGQKTEMVLDVLKTLQCGTRVLQNCCGELKGSRDSSLSGNVPPLRKVLEQFLFEVKKLLASNKNLQAFWVGNLKHKTIKGEEISSQLDFPMTQKEVPLGRSLSRSTTPEDEEMDQLEEELFGELNEDDSEDEVPSSSKKQHKGGKSRKTKATGSKDKDNKDGPQTKKRRLQKREIAHRELDGDEGQDVDGSYLGTVSPLSEKSAYSLAQNENEENDHISYMLRDEKDGSSSSIKHNAIDMDEDSDAVEEKQQESKKFIAPTIIPRKNSLTQKPRLAQSTSFLNTQTSRPSGLKRSKVSLHQGLSRSQAKRVPENLSGTESTTIKKKQCDEIKAFFDDTADSDHEEHEKMHDEDDERDVDIVNGDGTHGHNKYDSDASQDTDLDGFIDFGEDDYE